MSNAIDITVNSVTHQVDVVYPDGTTSTTPIVNFLRKQTISGWQTGPKGDKGDPGDSAYQVWLDEGNTGTEADFIAAISGTGLPVGGTTGQYLRKASNTDGDATWQPLEDIDGGGF